MALLPPPKPVFTSTTATAAPNPTGATTSETSTTTSADTNADTTMADAATPNPKKRKRKDTQKDKEKQAHILFQTTFRKTSWCYLHLVLVTPSALATSSTSTSTHSTQASASASPQQDLSPLLISRLLTSSLRCYLGTTGAAIPIDLLKTSGRNVWVRVPRGDARGVRAAVSGWVGSVDGAEVFGGDSSEGGKVEVAWRVVGCEASLGLLGAEEGDGHGDGRALFG